MTIDQITEDEFTDTDLASFETEREKECHKERTVFTFGSNNYKPVLGEEISKPHWRSKSVAHAHMVDTLEEYAMRGRDGAILYELGLDADNQITYITPLIERDIEPEKYL